MPIRPFVVAAMLLAAPDLHAAEALTPDQKQAVETIVRDYLRQHPEAIVEALQEMQAREQVAEEARGREALAALRDDLMHDAAAPVLGNPEGDVTVVEFFDYRCSYCKSVFGEVMATLVADGKIRYVLREFPILGPASLFASRAALAVWQIEPGRYGEFHTAMMKSTGNLTEDKVLRLAADAGLDREKLRVAMESPAIEAAIARNYELAKSLEIKGTPAFVIGDRLVPGAVSGETLKRLIAEARDRS